DRLTDSEALRDDVVPGDERPPRARPQQRREHANRRRLAGAVRTEQSEDLSFLDLERDSALRLHLAEANDEPVDENRRPLLLDRGELGHPPTSSLLLVRSATAAFSVRRRSSSRSR